MTATPDSPRRAPDPRLRDWLDARDDAEAERALTALVESVAMPVVRRTLARKGAGETGSLADAEDMVSRVREQILRATQRMREPGAAPIQDFPAYVAAITQTVWAECLRSKYPARTLLGYRLRYLLENRSGQTGFALWSAADGRLFCGFAAWQKTPPASDDAVRQLIVNPHLGDGSSSAAAAELPLAVARTLRWLGAPVSFGDLLAVLAQRFAVADTVEPLAPEHEAADPAPGPEDSMKWREYLTWLWKELQRLPLRQRRAFLLHSTVAHELEYGSVANVRQQAAVLELGPEPFVEYWNRLPLDDLTIAALLGVTRQQVINLRKVARASLGSAWQRWIGGPAGAKVFGHKRALSPTTLKAGAV